MTSGVLPASGRRSALSVPAADPHRIDKALAAGADEVVVDLEDAVAAGDKAAAREVLRAFDWSRRPETLRLAVRINAVGGPWWHRDLETVVALPIDSVVVPKVESRGDVFAVERLLDGLESEDARPDRIAVQALVETASGLARLHDIVSDIDRLDSLIIGYADLAASIGRSSAPSGAWIPAQHQILVAARSAGIAAVDGPYLGVADDDDFRRAAAEAAAFGFDAKWVIHPRQLETVNTAFTPSAEAVDYAQRVATAMADAAREGRGALQLDGQLIDEAMVRSARRVLAKVGR
jgi:citrate lyase subunit beta/citryl-CoA lyase